MNEVIDLMNYGFKSGNTQMFKIQQQLIDVFSKTPHTKEEISNFEARLFMDSRAFGDKQAYYTEIDRLMQYWNLVKFGIEIKEPEFDYGHAKAA